MQINEHVNEYVVNKSLAVGPVSPSLKDSGVQSMHYHLQHLADRRPFRSQEGVTALEYALLAAIIAIAIIAGVTAIGTNLSNFFVNFADNFRI